MDANPTPDPKDILTAHAKFWEGAGRLVRTAPYMPREDLHLPIAGRGPAEGDMYLEPDMLEPEDFLEPAATPGRGALPTDGDVLRIKSAPKLPWTEAVMGCPVKLLPRSGAAWAERCLTGPAEIADRTDALADNPWLRKLVEITRVLAEHADGAYFVTHVTMRGPLDMADAMLGTEKLLLAMADRPEDVRRLLEVCTEAFIEIARAQWAAISPARGGHVSRYGIWAPGRVTRSQADLAAMLSPDLYRRMVMPFDLQALRAFDYSILHTHSAFPHLAEAYLDQDVPTALQIGVDEPPFGPPVAEMLPFLKRVLKAKPLIFHGVVSSQEAQLVQNELPATGLFLDLLIQ